MLRLLLCVETFSGLRGEFIIEAEEELISDLLAGLGRGFRTPPAPDTEPTPLSVESVEDVLPEAFI